MYRNNEDYQYQHHQYQQQHSNSSNCSGSGGGSNSSRSINVAAATAAGALWCLPPPGFYLKQTGRLKEGGSDKDWGWGDGRLKKLCGFFFFFVALLTRFLGSDTWWSQRSGGAANDVLTTFLGMQTLKDDRQQSKHSQSGVNCVNCEWHEKTTTPQHDSKNLQICFGGGEFKNHNRYRFLKIYMWHNWKQVGAWAGPAGQKSI